MTHCILALCLLFSQAAFSNATPTNPLKEDEKLSYSLGVNVGEQFRDQMIEVNPAVFTEGVQDGLKNNLSRMTQKDIQEVMSKFQQEQVVKTRAHLKSTQEKNASEGKAFLEKNKSQPAVVTLPSGLQYKIVNPGEGASPGLNDVVTVHYRGTLINGTEFDNSYIRGNPATFAVKGVIPGWIEALQLMKPGAKWLLYIPSSLAYGEQGAGRLIGPNATLNFEVELLSIKPQDAVKEHPGPEDELTEDDQEEEG